MAVAISKQQIESSLKVVFAAQNFKRFDINILGGSEKGDGYIGDIVFVELTTIDPTGASNNYNLVLKCSKNSEIAREKGPIREVFCNEIYFYKNVLPEFMKFQKERGIEKPFNNTAKFYGAFINDNSEMIVFENLKTIGFELWARQQPLTRKHLDLVIEAYGKFHAMSAAMQDQDPERFDQLLKGVREVFEQFKKTSNLEKLFGSGIDSIHSVLKNVVDDNILKKWSGLKDNINHILDFISVSNEGFRVFTHGDCWNNNFMFKSTEKAILLDWQIMRYTSPILDLSYFLYACISKDDIHDLDNILKYYYKTFSDHVTKLGSDPNHLYPEQEFFADWKEKSRFGLLMASLIFKISIIDKDDAPDVTATVEKGEDFAEAFVFEINDNLKPKLRDRSEHVVKYVIENHLI